MTTITDRSGGDRDRYIDGLRALASVLEQHPEVPLPYEGCDTAITFHFLRGDNPKAEMAATARALPCTWRKETGDYRDKSYFDLYGEVAGVRVHLVAYREAVCRRIVKGQKTITEEVPDPDAPKIKQTRVVEDVEWECAPVLAALPDPPQAVSA